jgi:hypothetical protein
MNEQSLNNSHVNSKDYLELDLSKIKEFINILEEHLQKCEKEGRFVEAELTYNKLKQFKKIEKEKMIKDSKQSSKICKKKMENSLNEELEKFNTEMDSSLKELKEKIELHRNEIIMKQDQEMNELKDYFENKYPKEPRPPSELLNLKKILGEAVKHKEYFYLNIVIRKHMKFKAEFFN